MTVKISVERRSLEFDSVTATERPSELLSCRTIAVLSFYWLFGVVIHPFGFDKGEGQQDERWKNGTWGNVKNINIVQ